MKEEIFGPVTAVMGAQSNEETIALANNTQYGLQAGTVSVNCVSEGDNTTPFSGYKLSGFGGKDKGRESHDQYPETKTVFVNIEL